jgi:hypothetical protein
MAKASEYSLVQDRKGMIWDLLLYVPTVGALALISFKLWFSGNRAFAYVLCFMASFFFIVGLNRILTTRLMLLPSSPVGLETAKQQLTVMLRDGGRVALAKDVRFYPDYAGKSFGLSGMDVGGKRRQFVFHRGQFADEAIFKELCSSLNIYK